MQHLVFVGVPFPYEASSSYDRLVVDSFTAMDNGYVVSYSGLKNYKFKHIYHHDCKSQISVHQKLDELLFTDYVETLFIEKGYKGNPTDFQYRLDPNLKKLSIIKN